MEGTATMEVPCSSGNTEGPATTSMASSYCWVHLSTPKRSSAFRGAGGHHIQALWKWWEEAAPLRKEQRHAQGAASHTFSPCQLSRSLFLEGWIRELAAHTNTESDNHGPTTHTGQEATAGARRTTPNPNQHSQHRLGMVPLTISLGRSPSVEEHI